MPQLEDKVRLIEDVMGFFLDAPIMETAKDFPSPEDFIEDWYLSATIFRNIRDSERIEEKHYETLMIFIEEAEAEYASSKMLGEDPDTEDELGVGYDGYDIPDDFARKYQAKIWREVLAVHETDGRVQEWRIAKGD